MGMPRCHNYLVVELTAKCKGGKAELSKSGALRSRGMRMRKKGGTGLRYAGSAADFSLKLNQKKGGENERKVRGFKTGGRYVRDVGGWPN